MTSTTRRAFLAYSAALLAAPRAVTCFTHGGFDAVAAHKAQGRESDLAFAADSRPISQTSESPDSLSFWQRRRSAALAGPATVPAARYG